MTASASVAQLPVTVDKQDGIVVITLNRPQAHNALTPEMVCRLADAFVDFANDDDLRVAVLAAAGDRTFCAGGDLARSIPLLTGARLPEDEWDRRFLEDAGVSAASALRGFPLFKPVIAAINGACRAAGTEIVLGTDIRIAAENASFGLPEVQRAIVPFAGSMVRLPRQVSYCQAMELLLVGQPISAQEAFRIGLINHVVPAAEVMPKAMQIARAIAANGPVAVQRIKQTVIESSGVPLDQGYRLEDETKRIVMLTDDAVEGPRAFMEKRPPVYRGK